MAIRSDTSGFILPEGLTYEFKEAKSFFKSVSKNRYNLRVSGEKLREIGAHLYEHRTHHVNYTKSEVKEYIRAVYTQEEWQKLLKQSEKTKWHAYIGKL